MERWISDDVVNERWPHYTRANAAEVGPEPFTPLGWTLGMRDACRPGITDGWVALGILSEAERAYNPDGTASFGGWIYNNMSLARMVGLRMPGGDPDMMERTSFGHYEGVPPYKAHPDDVDPAQTEKVGGVLAWIMSGTGIDDLPAAATESEQRRASRPDPDSFTDRMLLEHARSFFPLIRTLWRMHMQASIGASVATGGAQAIAGALNRGDDSFALFTSIGGVVSADASLRIWELGRIVRRSAQLMETFEQGGDGLIHRLTGLSDDDPDVRAFQAGFAELLAEHGHRGPNEWDLASRSWELEPHAPLSMVERLRLQEDARAPLAAATTASSERTRLTGELAALLPDDPSRSGFLAAVGAGAVFLASRERTKSSLIRCLNEMRVVLWELGRRRKAAGVLEDDRHVFMLLSDELDDFVANGSSPRWRSLLARRADDHARLSELEPPFFIDGTKGVPPLNEWPRRRTARVAHAVAGDVLHGGAGAPGVVEGTARVVLDPSHADHLEPGDIMVVEMTDPSWTPLFLSVAGVVANVGALISHAAIVCREVGVPCVVACENATSRIVDGTRIRINGSTGAVEVL